jgi:ATP-dependent DNA helicase RecQ
MIRRDLPFDQLDIDFDALELRKKAELEKLNQIVSFALSGSCRNLEILRYFGEQNSEPCGHCDNCRNYPTRVEQIPSGKSLEAVIMVLSGVARTQARFACGKNLIAQMLCGSGNEKIKKLRLHQLSTFGLLKNLKQPEVVTLIDALVSLGCLQQEEIDKFRPVIKLTDFGTEVMKSKKPLQQPLPIPEDLFYKIHGKKISISKTPPENKQPIGPDAAVSYKNSADLLAALKRWRLEIADETGIPVYWILNNATLTELAAIRPRTAPELLDIKGIGPAKAKQFAQSLLDIIAEYTP